MKRDRGRRVGAGGGRRRASASERRSARNKAVIAVMVGLMVLSLFVAPLLSLLAG